MFGKMTLLQQAIKLHVQSLIDSRKTAKNRHYTDGDCLNDELKETLDKFITLYPGSPFAKDSSKHGPIFYTQKILQFGHGWSADYKIFTSTAIFNYLLEMGAGVGVCLSEINMHKLQSPHLFVGIYTEFMDEGQFDEDGEQLLKNHVRNYHDIIRLHENEKLSEDDLKRLERQAVNALRYGDFDDTIKLELVKVIRAIEVCSTLTQKEIDAYVVHKVEILTVLLQVQHQAHADCTLPAEMTSYILSYITGLDNSEIQKMREKLLEQHAASFPAIMDRVPH